MSLITWHDRLHQHFQELHQERILVGTSVFALEHGLSLPQLEELQADIRAYIQKYSPTDKHWLPWIVHAAELGYKYDGHEYWGPFKESTVGWHERGRDPHWVRDKFREFERNYGGAVPTGSWAQHFPIICHPITHSILPEIFQSQLASVLDSIQHFFTVEILQSPDLLGELIATHSLNQSDRFQQFAQNVQMVGLIAKALLNEEENYTSKILRSSTLQRIVADLKRDSVAREQLYDARRRAQVIQRRGLSGGRSSSRSASYGSRGPARDAIAIEPRLVLRRTAATSWQTLLEIPDFTPLLDTQPAWRRFLEQTRAVVNGLPLARGRLLFGTNTIPLRTCPEVGKPLIKFEGDETPDELKGCLEKNFSLNIGATILCRIASDGQAYQSRGLLVRPRRTYIVLSTAGPVRSSRFTSPVNTACEGLHAAHLSIPETITLDCETLIKSLGLNIAKELNVFPVGFAAAKWDDEGYGEWLTSDEPCIGIHVNHQVDSLLLELDDEEESSLEVHPEEAGQTVFVQMPPISRGQYQLSVSSRDATTGDYEEVGQLQITIREPRLWKAAINQQGALITIVEPRKPSIEQLMRGAAGIEMHGPSGHLVQVTATFFGKHSAAPLEPPHKLPNLHLPVKFNSGRTYLAQLSRKPELQSALDFAYSCRLEFDAGELGSFSLVCEREFTPLRWIVGSNGTSYLLSLSDDSGAPEKATITRYDFCRPDYPVPVPYNQSFEDHVVPSSGGLYVARGDSQCSIIFPHEVAGGVRTFADMNRTVVEPRFRSCQSSIEGLQDALALFKLWAESRTTGNMIAMLAQQRVLQAYIAHVFGIIGGARWEVAEGEYRSNPYHPSAALKLSRAVEASGVGADLMKQYETMKDATPNQHAARLAESLKPHIRSIGSMSMNITAQTGVRVLKGGRRQAEFALRMASAPETVEYWSQTWFADGLKALLDNQLLARAARFIVLTTSQHLQNTERNQHTSLYAGWDWI